ncbi:hypothetical protein BCR42DRAFT_370267 [Absidia repens]|uniref:BTB domain-containing protein n=1 Tax=Absidia repens TaxID=90262 RepID=A0A1X2IQH7_9FUNG|nr:hypothetical protein BCR42DRAFT_370267 [Absidia repens]
MTTNYKQHAPSPTYQSSFSLTATEPGTPYYVHDRSPLPGQQQLQQQQSSIQSLPLSLPAPMMNHHLQQEPTFFTSLAPLARPPTVSSGYVYNDSTIQDYCNYFYQFGFLQGKFSDITVTIPSIAQTFALHSLVICRSPYFYQRLIHLQHHHYHQPNNTKPVLELEYKQVMPESFRSALAHLYSPFSYQYLVCMVNERPQLCFELIGIADYLELTTLRDRLIHILLSQDFNQTSAVEWALILHSSASTPSHTQPWTHALSNRLLLYLAQDLPAQLMAFPTASVKMNMDFAIGKHHTRGFMTSKTVTSHGTTNLAELYSSLPSTFLKRCLESPNLPVQDTLQRYVFARKVLQLRSSSSSSSAKAIELDDVQITAGLQFCSNEQQQKSITPTHSPSKNSPVMTLSLINTPLNKLGKWNPSLYEYEWDESDDDEDLYDDYS